MTPIEIITTLERLKALRDGGLLSEAELAAEKERILSVSLANSEVVGEQPIGPAVISRVTTQSWGFNSISDLITTKLGLDKIEEFSLKTFFSNVFGKHDPNEIENIFSVGTQFTTPSLDPTMARFPSPWIFFRVLLASLVVYGLFYFAWSAFNNPLMLPGLIFTGAFAMPFATLILFFELNTPRNVSITRVAMFSFVGGTVSILISLFLFRLTSLESLFGASSAGFVEESAKLAAVVLSLSRIDRARYPYRLNALLFGAAVGAGFAIFETAGYVLTALAQTDSIDAMSDTITVRGILSPFCHIAWTAIASTAYWSAQRKHGTIGATITSSDFLKIFAVPVILHFIWNMSEDHTLVYLALGFVAWVVIVSFAQTGLREIGETTALKPST